MNQEGGQWGGNRKPVRVATVNEMVQILAQLPGNCHFNKACEEAITKFLDVAPRDPDAVKFIDVADPGKEDQGTTRSWQEASGAPPWFREAIADAVATGIEQGVKATQAALRSAVARPGARAAQGLRIWTTHRDEPRLPKSSG